MVLVLDEHVIIYVNNNNNNIIIKIKLVLWSITGNYQNACLDRKVFKLDLKIVQNLTLSILMIGNVDFLASSSGNAIRFAIFFVSPIFFILRSQILPACPRLFWHAAILYGIFGYGE